MSDDADLVRRRAESLWAADVASRHLGMVLEAVGPGWARISMRVRPEMVNGLGLCHGGLVFTLADSTMAFAANAHGERAVAHQAAITWLRPTKADDTLIAEAREVSRAGRSGMYDVRVVRASDGATVAEFRGHTRLAGGRFFTPEA
jgi:phenylacetic acid degradation protein PaaD